MGERATIEIVDEMGEHFLLTSTFIGMANMNRSASLSGKRQQRCGRVVPEYAAARLVAHICNSIDKNEGAMSVGLQEPGDNEQAAALLDHGHYIVDMGEGTVTQYSRWIPHGEVVRETSLEFYGG